jgi:glutamate decarboxylase
VHVTWEKFCRYFDVEPRMVPLAEDRYVIDPAAAASSCDENTIGVVGILGSTYTGHFDPIGEIDDAVGALNEAEGWQIPVHVDAASGGFVAPFAYPDLVWDFRLPNVHSINVSGHKYGLVFPGVGWAIWRVAEDLPDELIFHDSYLGNDQSTFDLNFSKSASQVIGQYYNLIRLGRAGYTDIMANLIAVADYLEDQLTSRPNVTVISDRGNLPLVCARVHDDAPFNAHDIAAHLRARGWIVPAYNMPDDLGDMTVLRVVVREGFTRDLVDKLVEDLIKTRDELLAAPPPAPRPPRPSKQRPC